MKNQQKNISRVMDLYDVSLNSASVTTVVVITKSGNYIYEHWLSGNSPRGAIYLSKNASVQHVMTNECYIRAYAAPVLKLKKYILNGFFEGQALIDEVTRLKNGGLLDRMPHVLPSF